jgi:CelD/BcsL family acetyltransferase involved in cellulose biosynthesis
VRIETVHPKELGEAQLARWRGLQAGEPALASPYLTPDWAQLIGAVRADARVCILNGGEGFFSAQRLSRYAAMGMGAPIADYQAVVAGRDLIVDPAELCAALKVGRIDLTHVPTGATPLAAGGEEGSWIAETHGGRELYEAALKARRSEFVRQTDKKARKLERECGHLEFRACSAERADFETLLAWKNDQLARSRQPRIWAQPWVRQTLDQCFEIRGPHFGGALFTLSLDGKLIAGAFCLRSASVLHFWIVAHDSAYDRYSPGVQLARRAIGWAGEHGLAEVDFGPGDYQYKRQLSTTQRMLSYGVVAGASVSGVVRRTAYSVRAGIERLPHPRLAALPGKAMRRLDLIRALAA